jgi:hypothetical protein
MNNFDYKELPQAKIIMLSLTALLLFEVGARFISILFFCFVILLLYKKDTREGARTLDH